MVTFSIAGPKFWRTFHCYFFFVSKVQRRQANIFSGECICGFSNSCLRFLSAYPSSSSVGARGVSIVFFCCCLVCVAVCFFECLCIPSAALLLLNDANQTLDFEARRPRLERRNLTCSARTSRGAECQLGYFPRSDPQQLISRAPMSVREEELADVRPREIPPALGLCNHFFDYCEVNARQCARLNPAESVVADNEPYAFASLS